MTATGVMTCARGCGHELLGQRGARLCDGCSLSQQLCTCPPLRSAGLVEHGRWGIGRGHSQYLDQAKAGARACSVRGFNGRGSWWLCDRPPRHDDDHAAHNSGYLGAGSPQLARWTREDPHA